MPYPKIVYHKDYMKAVGEKEREAMTKKVISEEDHKRHGSDWGDHPALSKKSEEKPLESKPEVKSVKVSSKAKPE